MESEFELQQDLIHLNHAAVGPWPRCTREAVEAFARENATEGSFHYPEWVKKETRLRQLLAQLIHAPQADDIALLKNTSEALSVVAHGLTWQAGDNVVISDQEFPSNRIVWESLQDRGVEVLHMHMDAAALLPGHLPVHVVYEAIIDIDVFVRAFFVLRHHVDSEQVTLIRIGSVGVRDFQPLDFPERRIP